MPRCNPEPQAGSRAGVWLNRLPLASSPDKLAGGPAKSTADPGDDDGDRFAVGAVVLACETPGEGWFEVTVAAHKGADLVLLRWRDWPDLPPFVRRRDHLALLPPALNEQVQEQIMNDAASRSDEGKAVRRPSPDAVRTLNDALRRTCTGGRVMLTAGVGALPDQERNDVLVAVQTFDHFDADIDPHGEHDFRAV